MPVQRRFMLFALGSALMARPKYNTAWASERTVVKMSPDLLAGAAPGLEIAFYALDMVTGSIAVMNEDQVDRRRAPWSTFKIPNLIIALERGIASDLRHRRLWDEWRRPAADHWPQTWRQDQTLASAFKRSAVWYFQDIALEVGAERYRSDLKRFGYGNAAVPMDSDDFWLGGPLAISPREQAEFLRQVLDGSLTISRRTRDALHEVSLLKTSDGYALHGKTGSGRLADDTFEGWLVGWTEREGVPLSTFALYMRAPDYRLLEAARFDTAKTLLQASGHLPQGWS